MCNYAQVAMVYHSSNLLIHSRAQFYADCCRHLKIHQIHGPVLDRYHPSLDHRIGLTIFESNSVVAIRVQSIQYSLLLTISHGGCASLLSTLKVDFLACFYTGKYNSNQ